MQIRLSSCREISPSTLFLFGIHTDVINTARVQLTGSAVGGGTDRHAPLLVLILGNVDLAQDFNHSTICEEVRPLAPYKNKAKKRRKCDFNHSTFKQWFGSGS
jgi:hypothetical protein